MYGATGRATHGNASALARWMIVGDEIPEGTQMLYRPITLSKQIHNIDQNHKSNK